jgi:hypothetical protein
LTRSGFDSGEIDNSFYQRPLVWVKLANGVTRGDRAADNELAEKIGKQLDATMRQVVADELRRQMRPRGMLNM